MDKYIARAIENIEQIMRMMPSDHPNREDILRALWKADDALHSMKLPKPPQRPESPCPCGDCVEEKVLVAPSGMGHLPPEAHIKTIVRSLIKEATIDGVKVYPRQTYDA